MQDNQTTPNLEDVFQDLFKTSVSGSGEDELLKTASEFSMQLTGKQVRLLSFLSDKSNEWRIAKKIVDADRLDKFIETYLKLKRNNNSDAFVMRALDSVSLRKFINENTMKVNIQKQ